MKQTSYSKTKSETKRQRSAAVVVNTPPLLHAPFTNIAKDVSANIQIVRSYLTNGVLIHVDREQLIAEAAYHHAEARGFTPGHELEDWLVAETEVDARLSGEGRAY